LLGWRVPLFLSLPISIAISFRPGKRLNMVALRTSTLTSLLCRLDVGSDDVDTLASAYDTVLMAILDTLLPVRHFIRRASLCDAWFDEECRDAKRLARTLQRRYSSRCHLSDSSGAALARDTLYHQRGIYRQLRHRKASDFCHLHIVRTVGSKEAVVVCRHSSWSWPTGIQYFHVGQCVLPLLCQQS